MIDSTDTHVPILAAGGIVLREGARPRIAIVRLRRDKSWVLPKGKLNRGERALAAARREVLEETGHRVSVHGFLGSMLYSVDGRIKIVQFWHMRATREPMREPMNDVKAVKWLSLKQAIETLTRPHEKLFLANVGTAPHARDRAASTSARNVRRISNITASQTRIRQPSRPRRADFRCEAESGRLPLSFGGNLSHFRNLKTVA